MKLKGVDIHEPAALKARNLLTDIRVVAKVKFKFSIRKPQGTAVFEVHRRNRKH
jgi:hypothetical protein